MILVGSLVRLPGSFHPHVIWRVNKVESKMLWLQPVFALFDGIANVSNRIINDSDESDGSIVQVKMVDLGIEYMAFTEFLQRESKRDPESLP